ncbi:glycosyltransferase [Austwickia chelonae]|uniref:glycosyltransferase n=1 Tax=Austwickia chelonae TaxID=100225 RepID=UPI0013C2AEDF|nr:glycosyltransferase [Austwickia chelonae]
MKDEEERLPACLESLTAIREILKEVCIYDTGSSDATVAIAQQFGCHVQQGHWDDDFARARNESLAMASTEWVLWIDADERLQVDATRLAQVLKETSKRVSLYGVHLVNRGPNGAELGIQRLPRLFRRGCYSFAGGLHEKPVHLDHGYREETALLPMEIVLLRHEGYADVDSCVAKSTRNIEIALKELEQAPPGEEIAEMDRRRINLAKSYLIGLRYAEAIEVLTPIWRLGATSRERHAGELITLALLSLDATDMALHLAELLRGQGSDPEYCDWLIARAHHQAGRHLQAAALLQKLSTPTDATGVVVGATQLTGDLVLALVAADRSEEALAVCLTRVQKGVPGLALPLVELWGDRDRGALWQLLSSLGPHVLADVRAQIRGVLDKEEIPT